MEVWQIHKLPICCISEKTVFENMFSQIFFLLDKYGLANKYVFVSNKYLTFLTNICLFCYKRPASTQLHMVHSSFEENCHKRQGSFYFLVASNASRHLSTHTCLLGKVVARVLIFVAWDPLLARRSPLRSGGEVLTRGETGLFSICWQFNQHDPNLDPLHPCF